MSALKEYWESLREEQEEIDLELHEHDLYFAAKKDRERRGVPSPVPKSLRPKHDKKGQVC